MNSINCLIAEWDDPANASDELNRSEFAERVANGLRQWKSPESLIVAIYGPWGSGKTWLLNRIASSLGQGGFRICSFTPWHFESNEQISAEFFSAVLERLQEGEDSIQGAKQRAQLWKSLGLAVTAGHLGTVAGAAIAGLGPGGVPAALGAVGKLFYLGSDIAGEQASQRSVSALRDQLNKSFSQPDAPKILVAIDDLDRLADQQIQMIFRLVKMSANFPNLHYLILGERKQLARALDTVSSGEGDRYLEKIVQIPLTLPEPDSYVIMGRLWRGLEQIANDCSYPLEDHAERFESFWGHFLNRRVTNFRNVHRLLSTTAFHAAALTRDNALEVDLLDLLAIDFLRIFAPTTYASISRLPPDAERLFTRLPYDPDVKERKDSAAALDLLKESELGDKGAFFLLTHLYPEFYSLLPDFARNNGRYFNSTLLSLCLTFIIGFIYC